MSISGSDENPKLESRQGIPLVSAVEAWWMRRKILSCQEKKGVDCCSICDDISCEAYEEGG